MNINPKVGYAAVAGAIGTIIVWGLNTYAHVTLPPEVSAAGVTIITALVGYQTNATKGP